MTPNMYPPGPTWKSECQRPFKEWIGELSSGLLPILRGRFGRFGDLFYISNRGVPMYVTRHPDHLQEVLVTRASSFLKRSRDLERFLGKGLLTSDGELWRRQRRLIQPAFQSGNIARYATVMVDHAERLMARWKPGEVRNVNRDMMGLTLSIVCKTLFNHDVEEESDAVAQAMTLLQSTAGRVDVFPKWLPTPLHRSQQKAIGEFDRIVFPMIDAKAADAKAVDGSQCDLLAQLKVSSDEQGAMTRTQLRDELVTLFLAGHETTALVLAWMFLLLAQNPREEELLHEEIDRVLGRRRPSFQELESLPFTRLVVLETLRLYPPLYLLPRIAKDNTEIGGYPVAAGSEVLLWMYFTHRDPRWFPQPVEFRPSRYLSPSGEIVNPYAYLPFGAGPRTCVGRHFAMAEAQLILARIAQDYRLRLAADQDVKMFPRFTLGPLEPIRMEIEARRAGG